MRKSVSFALAAVLLLSACATTASGGPRYRQDVITAEEMATVNVSNLYDLVQHLRPRWLDVRSPRSFNSETSLVVFHGQSYLGGVEHLRQLGVDAAHLLRYLDGPTASATLPGLGGRHVEAAIVVNPKD